MAIELLDVTRIKGNTPIEDRLVRNTVDEVFNGAVAETFIAPLRRYDGLAVWIKSEKKLYRFVGGTAQANFVPDAAGTEMIETIIETLFESETLVETFIEKLLESDAVGFLHNDSCQEVLE